MSLEFLRLLLRTVECPVNVTRNKYNYGRGARISERQARSQGARASGSPFPDLTVAEAQPRPRASECSVRYGVFERRWREVVQSHFRGSV